MELSTGNLQAGLEAEFVVCPKLNKVLGKPNREFRVEVLLEPAEKVQDVRVIYERDDSNIQVKFVPKVPGTYNITLKINGDKLVSSPFTVQVKERRIDVVGELDVKGEIRKQPSGIAVNGKGLIAVADIYRHCILIFSEKGDFVRKLGCYGKKPGQLSSPADVTFMNDDKILVADQLNHCIQQFNVQTGRSKALFKLHLVSQAL